MTCSKSCVTAIIPTLFLFVRVCNVFVLIIGCVILLFVWVGWVGLNFFYYYYFLLFVLGGVVVVVLVVVVVVVPVVVVV